jgi:hypothetical protein
MANRYISLPDELNDKLKLEENASGLITKLLIDHYSLVTSPIEKLEEVKREIEKRSQEANSLQIKIDEMQRRKDEIVEQELQKETNKEDSEEVWERRKRLQREAFNNYEVEKDKAEELFLEFFNLLREKKVSNIIEFMQSKQIKRKEKKNAKL